MVEIFIQYHLLQDWKATFQSVLPKRKLQKQLSICDYDYHTIEDQGGIQTIKHSILMKYQLKHHLDIYANKLNLNINVESKVVENIFYSLLFLSFPLYFYLQNPKKSNIIQLLNKKVTILDKKFIKSVDLAILAS